MADEKTFVKLVYCGERETRDGKLAHKFLMPDGSAGLFTPKKRMHWIIGRTYTFESSSTDGSTVYLSTGVLSNEDPYAATDKWRLEAREALTNIDAAAAFRRMERTAKEDNKDFGDLTLDEVRRLVAPSRTKAAIVTAVMDYIRPY